MSKILVWCLVLTLNHAVWATDGVGTVVKVTDGDTLVVLDGQQQQHTIRLAGIDAPEKAQPFGQRSKANLATIVFNREVEIIGDKRDRFGRTVAKIMVADPNCDVPACPKVHDAGMLQIMAGMAWWYRKYAKEQLPKDREAYEVSEFLAKNQKVGLWADRNPIPPWYWRHERSSR